MLSVEMFTLISIHFETNFGRLSSDNQNETGFFTSDKFHDLIQQN